MISDLAGIGQGFRDTNIWLRVDIDFVGDDVRPSELHRSIMQIAKELKIDVE